MRMQMYALLLVICVSNYADYPVSYLFSHGLRDRYPQAFLYSEEPDKPHKPYIMKYPLVAFDYPDASTGVLKINRLETSLAQDNEIKRLEQVYSSYLKDKPSILVGVSRGASTIINFIGRYNPGNVLALVLESPFDCVENIVQSLIHRYKMQWIPGLNKKCGNLMGFLFCKYNPKGIRPIESVEKIPLDLPILLVCSVKDALVPVWSSLNLYKALYNRGHKNTYILVLSDGKHAKLITDPIYGAIYQQVAHAFYQKFGLPHDPIIAQKGKSLLLYCQPHPGMLQSLYPNHEYCEN